MSRPHTTLNEEQIQELINLSKYLTKQQLAEHFGMSRPTFDKILARDKGKLDLHYKKGKASLIAKVAEGLANQAVNGNTIAAMFFLKTQAGWREVKDEKLTVIANSNILPTTIVNKLVDETVDNKN